MNTLRAALLAVMLTMPGARGQDPAAAPADGAEPPNVVIVRNVEYGRALLADGREVILRLHAAFPAQSEGPLPAVVYVHGGAWRAGSKDDGLPFLEPLARGGYLAVSVGYRLADMAPYPAALEDCRASVRFLRVHAEELGIDPDRIGIWGHTAGGHLGALLATAANEPGGEQTAVACAVSIAGSSDLRPYGPFDGAGPGGEATAIVAAWLGPGTPEEVEARAGAASPVTHVDGGDPPMLLVHGTQDELVPIEQTETFAGVLREAGVAVTLRRVEAGHHFADAASYRTIAAFFDTHLGGHALRTLGEAPATERPVPAGGRDDGERSRRMCP